jgi:hypothetical protein
MTQPERLQAHLDTLQPITRLSALTELGIFELSSRIGELTKSGYPIQRQMITVVNRWGESIRVMEYKKKVEKLPRVWPIKE